MAEKFNGTWLLETVDGNISEFLTYDGYGWMMRQAAWAAGYGAGTTKIDQVIHEGTVYSRREAAEWNIFRGMAKLDGKKQPYLYSEGYPICECVNEECEATVEEGKMKLIVYKPDGTLHITTVATVSEDGQTRTEVNTFPKGEWGEGADGGDCVTTLTYKKEAEARLSVADVTAWFEANVLVFDATEEGGPEKKKAVSTSLDGLFPTAQALMAAFEEVARQPKLAKETAELKEVSETEFEIAFDGENGRRVYSEKVDREACTLTTVISDEGTAIGTWHFKALSDPVRFQCWNTLDQPIPSLLSSIHEVEKHLDSILKNKK